MKNNYKYNKGFTLLEMIVSLGIFAVVAVIAVGALLKSLMQIVKL
jgi:prepilin-type N-terminal cleavage/methylation domain-containing protein